MLAMGEAEVALHAVAFLGSDLSTMTAGTVQEGMVAGRSGAGSDWPTDVFHKAR